MTLKQGLHVQFKLVFLMGEENCKFPGKLLGAGLNTNTNIAHVFIYLFIYLDWFCTEVQGEIQ